MRGDSTSGVKACRVCYSDLRLVARLRGAEFVVSVLPVYASRRIRSGFTSKHFYGYLLVCCTIVDFWCFTLLF